MTKPQRPSFSVAHLHVLPSGALFVHCLIYKIHAPHPRNSWYFTTSSFVCQELFSTFFTFFETVCRSPSLQTTYLGYHIELALSRTFFGKSCFFSVLRVSAAALADSFVRIPPHSPFVNTFFPHFSTFLSLPEGGVMVCTVIISFTSCKPYTPIL